MIFNRLPVVILFELPLTLIAQTQRVPKSLMDCTFGLIHLIVGSFLFGFLFHQHAVGAFQKHTRALAAQQEQPAFNIFIAPHRLAVIKLKLNNIAAALFGVALSKHAAHEREIGVKIGPTRRVTETDRLLTLGRAHQRKPPMLIRRVLLYYNTHSHVSIYRSHHFPALTSFLYAALHHGKQKTLRGNQKRPFLLYVLWIFFTSETNQFHN